VRLDNFVYTIEAIRAAAARLKPDGGMALYFMVGNEHIFSSLTMLLRAAYGEDPKVFQGDWELFNRVFLAGPAFSGVSEQEGRVNLSNLAPELAEAEVPTDDWPYLYLQKRGVSGFYLSLMLAFLTIAGLVTVLASRDMREGIRSWKNTDLEMFLFGLGFLLMETRFVTAINLVWGATWITSAVVFGAILATILCTTLLMEFRPIPWKVASWGLVFSIVVTFLVPVDALLADSAVLRLLLSALYVGFPIFFAAACFAERFKLRKDVDLAFGWNLLGAVAGGLIEFFGMLVGLKAMALVALVAYLGAFSLKGSKLEWILPDPSQE
jgi:hypothetical protein